MNETVVRASGGTAAAIETRIEKSERFGDARGGWRRRASRWVLEEAAQVWAFSEAARREIEDEAGRLEAFLAEP